MRGVTAAELEWVEGVVADLEAGRLGWSYEEIAERPRTSRHRTDVKPPDGTLS